MSDAVTVPAHQLKAMQETIRLYREALERIAKTHCGCWDKCRCGSDKLNEIAREALGKMEGEDV